MSQMKIPWFVVLPDTDDGFAVVERLRDRYVDVAELTHASGRPWLVGRWDDERLSVGRAGDSAVAVLGEHAVTGEWLAARAAEVARGGRLGDLRARIAGSFHLAASHDGVTTLYGDATGMRRVFHTEVAGLQVAGDHANVLAALSHGSVDPARIASRLLFTAPPWPLGWESVWTTVRAVWPGHAVRLDRQGRAREERWWFPPPAELSRADAAAALRAALREAVLVRAAPGQTVAAHLSGLDSSSLVSLATREGADVVALTTAQPDTLDEDVEWAARTAEELRRSGYGLRHEVLAADEVPLVYDGILTARDSFDEPFLAQHNREPYRHILMRGERHRPRVHLVGFGGDEMCSNSYQWLPRLLRSRPRLGFRHLQAITAKHRWSWTRVVRSMLTAGTYAAWLREAADRLPNHDVDMSSAEFGWGAFPALPTWLSAEGIGMVRDEIRRAAALDPVLDADRGMHTTLASIHSGAQSTRGFQQISAADGALTSAPFFDDRVMDAVLSVRLADRYDPGKYKPILVEAMRGIVPDVTLTRTTKSHTPANAVLGSRRHRDQIIGIVEDSELARLGIVDLARLRRTCHGPVDVETFSLRLEPTIACEIWLRNQLERENTSTGGRRSGAPD
ncbi:hypothetical protein GCM10017600_78820 [Streptosporangium carneum]|uniref:asparagine synthase (glutamine-hydrolyzing) n=1 Tax=Streptosporangium carneum TaxID=47481 RepID=A0A9W6MHR0_9ACTN|nr:hypothetical protein GCM10017600_78820 [Streptosporangium carneum]